MLGATLAALGATLPGMGGSDVQPLGGAIGAKLALSGSGSGLGSPEMLMVTGSVCGEISRPRSATACATCGGRDEPDTGAGDTGVSSCPGIAIGACEAEGPMG
eukprot:3178060-Rhodomonas_salina.1